MNIKLKHIVLFVVAILLVVLFIKRKPREEIATLIQSPLSLEPTRQKPEVIQSKQAIKGNSSGLSFSVIVARNKKEKAIGLKRMVLRREEGNALLNVKLTIKPACHPGDADAILKDLKAAPSHKLLAVLEDIAGNKKPLAWDLPAELFKQGHAEHLFKIPIKSEPSQYGFFICTAGSSDNTCSEKPTKDINEIFTEHLLKKPNAGRELRNIFFQYFLVDERGLAAFSGIPNGKQAFAELKKYTEEIKATGKTNRVELEFAKNAIQNIRSLPAVFSKDKLILELPKFQESACQ